VCAILCLSDIFQVQPLPAQLQCARCDAKERIPVDCGLPSMIKVYKGYYRPDGVPPTVSLISSIDVNAGMPPTMAVACPWGTKACAGGALHGNASCVVGHHGHFCAECWAGWFRGASSWLGVGARARAKARPRPRPRAYLTP